MALHANLVGEVLDAGNAQRRPPCRVTRTNTSDTTTQDDHAVVDDYVDSVGSDAPIPP